MTTPTSATGNRHKEGRPHRTESFKGYKFFNGKPISQVNDLPSRVAEITADQLRENMEVWRPEETVVAAVPFFNQGKVMIKGPPQSGKGTIIFGLTEMCDIMGVGYMYYDGHHQELSGEELAAQIRRADDMGYPVFFDSYDYLFLGSRTAGRSIKVEEQLHRNQLIVEALEQVHVPIAITIHDKEHSDAFLNPQLLERFKAFHDKFPVYEIPLYLQSDASAMRFLSDHGVPAHVADFLLGLKANSAFVDLVDRLQPVELDSTQLISSLLTYPVLKELVRGEKTRLFGIMDEVLKGPEEPGHEQALLDLAVLLEETEIKRLNLTQERRRKKKSHNTS